MAISYPSRLLAIFVAGLLFLAGCGPTQEVITSGEQEDRPTIRVSEFDLAAIEYPELRDFPLPEIERLTLDNGLTIFLVEDHELPLVNAQTRIATGSVHEPADKLGLAFITGTVMRTGGTGSMSAEEINERLEAIGASVETSIGQTSGSASMSALSEHVDEVLAIYADVLRNPGFAEERLETAKTQQRSAISRRNDDAQQIAFREFAKVVYGADSPYARTPEHYTVAAIEREDVVSFHEQYFHPNNIIMSVWGDFDASEMADRLRDAFADWPAANGSEPPRPPQPDADQSSGVHFVQKDDVTQSTILMGHAGELTRDHPDYFPVIVMNEVLSGGFSGRLFRNVRSAQGLAYSVFGNYNAGYERPGLFNAGVFTRSDATIEATEAVMREIERMREEPPTEEELSLAKDAYLNSFVFNFATKSQILDRLMTYEHFGYPEDFLDRIAEGVQEVTAADVHRVATRYLHPDEMDILIVGRQQDFDQPVSALAPDGEVNEIDITIPTQHPAEVAEVQPATEEELAAGQQRLAEVRGALGGEAFDQVRSFRQTSETTMRGPMGEQTLASTMLVATDPVRVRTEMTLPNGMVITIVDDGDQLTMETPQGTAPAPPQMRQQLRDELQRSLLYLMIHASEAEVRHAGHRELEGQTYDVLEIRFDEAAFTLLVDPHSDRPTHLEFEVADPQMGAPVQAVAELDEFEQHDGMLLPTRITAFHDGEEQAVTRLTELAFNVDPDDEAFELE